MYFFPLILTIWFLPKADALRCYDCTSERFGNCTETITECPSEAHQCAAGIDIKLLGGMKLMDTQFKGCALAKDCLEVSFNMEMIQIMYKNKCCTGELCNTEHVPESIPNGNKCFSCIGINCISTTPLSCLGNEDHCFTVIANRTGNALIQKGCASRVMCSEARPAALTEILKHFDVAEIHCCQGDYCNDAISTSDIIRPSDGARASNAGTSRRSDDLLLLNVLLISLVLTFYGSR